ncbi:unnamed protein product [Heligmosomoides polygyrus]|uniref:NR LBD domain-containing protein n=1 Tax=Heligmosomoides polygyrus TaxID=6339 RepID=A0A183GK96_HELPZ|nr:unnamed protein product [Heligmosomoides polygyrus]
MPKPQSDEPVPDLLPRLRSAHRALVDQVILQLRKLHVTETELLSLKAIMALDPNVKGLSMKSSGHLLVGRESVQNALFSHLMMRHPPSEATARFGHLLLLIASVTYRSPSIDIDQISWRENSGKYPDIFYVPGDSEDVRNTSHDVPGKKEDAPKTSLNVFGDQVDGPKTSSNAPGDSEDVPKILSAKGGLLRGASTSNGGPFP